MKVLLIKKSKWMFLGLTLASLAACRTSGIPGAPGLESAGSNSVLASFPGHDIPSEVDDDDIFVLNCFDESDQFKIKGEEERETPSNALSKTKKVVFPLTTEQEEKMAKGTVKCSLENYADRVDTYRYYTSDRHEGKYLYYGSSKELVKKVGAGYKISDITTFKLFRKGGPTVGYVEVKPTGDSDVNMTDLSKNDVFVGLNCTYEDRTPLQIPAEPIAGSPLPNRIKFAIQESDLNRSLAADKTQLTCTSVFATTEKGRKKYKGDLSSKVEISLNNQASPGSRTVKFIEKTAVAGGAPGSVSITDVNTFTGLFDGKTYANLDCTGAPTGYINREITLKNDSGNLFMEVKSVKCSDSTEKTATWKISFLQAYARSANGAPFQMNLVTLKEGAADVASLPSISKTSMLEIKSETLKLGMLEGLSSDVLYEFTGTNDADDVEFLNFSPTNYQKQ